MTPIHMGEPTAQEGDMPFPRVTFLDLPIV
jgi:hypothetical protein